MGEIVIHQPPGITISYFPSLTPIAGSIKAAILLQQIVYLTKHGSGPARWITKEGGQQEWIKDTGLTLKEFNLALQALETRRLIDREYDRRNHQLRVRLRIEVYNKSVDDLPAEDYPPRHPTKRHMPKGHMPKGKMHTETQVDTDTYHVTLDDTDEHVTKGHMPKGQMACDKREDEHMPKGHFVCSKEVESLETRELLQEKDSTTLVPSSSATTPMTGDRTKPSRTAPPPSQQPGELHPNTVQAILAMVVEPFHCLAKPTKLNEQFWDTQIKLIQKIGVIDFQDCLNSVDAYYAATPQKCPINEKAARARMNYGIKYAIQEAQKTLSGRRRYAN